MKNQEEALALIKPKTPVANPMVTPPDASALEAQLQAPSAAMRRQAARQLEAVPGAASLLAHRLQVETDATVREAILTSLMSLNSEAAAASIAPLLRSEDAVLRNEALQALQHMPAAAAAHMEPLLIDPDSDVRIFAINVLSALAHPQTQAWLLRLIETDTNINVCATAVDLLAEIGTPAAVPMLQALAQRFEHPFIQFAVATAIRRISE
jgi:HEAT repeat protein